MDDEELHVIDINDTQKLSAEIGLTDEAINIAKFLKISGWVLRRFNPALAILSQEIDDRQASKTDCGKYPTRNFVLTDTDRVKLRRLVNRFSDKKE